MKNTQLHAKIITSLMIVSIFFGAMNVFGLPVDAATPPVCRNDTEVSCIFQDSNSELQYRCSDGTVLAFLNDTTPKCPAVTMSGDLDEVVSFYCQEKYLSTEPSRIPQCQIDYAESGPTSDMIYAFCTDLVGGPASGYNTRHAECLDVYKNDEVLEEESTERAIATDLRGDTEGNLDSVINADFKGFSLNGPDAEVDGQYCGKKEGKGWVKISFPIGCLGESYKGQDFNPVIDMLFALLRFMSAGVGLVVTASIIWAGIQYASSRGNPQQTEAAIKRVMNSFIALLLYIFAFALLNFLVPGGLFVSI